MPVDLPFQPVVLWTDALLFLLLAVVIAGCRHALGQEHLRAPWRQVVRSRAGAVSAVVLAGFVLVAVLDSLHFHPRAGDAGAGYAPNVRSVFDVLATPLRAATETTYSAPFALHAYAKTMMDSTDGARVRDYPRLRHGGAHLPDDGSRRTADVLWRCAMGVLQGLAAWAFMLVAALAYAARRTGQGLAALCVRCCRGRTELPCRAVALTLLVIVAGTAVVFQLAPHYHLLGTDKVGQDVFFQALKGIRTGLLIGTLTTLVMLPFAILLGIIAGYFSGWIDDLIQYLYTTLNSIPGVLLIAAAVLMLQVHMANHAEQFTNAESRSDLRLLYLCLILGVTSWTGLCRLLRGEALRLREADYVQAARALGAGHLTIVLRHVLPNVMHIVMIAVVLDFSGLVLAEAVLSYIGIGVDPGMHSWGNMINAARLELAREPTVWWSLLAAFLFMFTLVLAANLFADAVRDAFDPQWRRGGGRRRASND